jgi:hypothetical protein
MTDELEEKPDQTEQTEGKPKSCTCIQDPFAALPPELRPRPITNDFGLRKVACPNCGFVYWTNRKTDLCVDCEKKGIHLPDPNTNT